MPDSSHFFALFEWLVVRFVMAALIVTGAVKIIVPEIRSVTRLLRTLPKGNNRRGS